MARKPEPPEWIQIGPYRMTPKQVRALMREDGVNMWLLHEAAASVAIDRDSHCRTVSLDEVTPEELERFRAQRAESRSGQPETD